MNTLHSHCAAAATPAGSRKRALLALLLVLSVVLAACETPEERAAGYVAEAEALLEEDNLVKAELEAKNALQIEPRNAKARFLLAEISEQRGDFGEMAANLRSAVEFDPNFLEARLKLGTIYALAGVVDMAQEQLDAAEALEPNSPEVRILKARLLAAGGDLEGATDQLRLAIEQKPDSMEALGLLANVTAASDIDAAIAIVDGAIASAEEPRVLRLLKIQLLQRAGDEASVEAEYRSLIADYPDESAYSYQLARFLASAGRPEDVEAVISDVIERDPENQQARLALVQFVAGIRGQDAARELLEGYLQENPDAHDLRMVLARQYQANGDVSQAQAEYQAVVERAGNEDVGLTAKGRLAAIELSQGNDEDGEVILEEVLAVDSMNVQALMLRGALNYERDKMKAAVSDLRSVLRRDPDNEQAQLLLARSHTKADDMLLARDAYRRAIQMNPQNVQATLELTRILVDGKELDKAEALLRDQIEVTPDDLNAPRALIAILVTRSRFDDALEEAERVSTIDGQEGVGAYLTGGIYQARDQHERAIEAFQRSLDAVPQAREPLQGLVASLVRLERSDEAIRYLEDFTASNPDNLYAKTLLGQVLAGSGETGAARELFEAALSDNSAWLPAYTALAGLDGADVGAQIDVYRRGLEAVPDSQELALLLGTAYERSGQYEEAIASYEEVLRSNPDMQVVANNLAALLADYRTDTASFRRALEVSEQFEGSENPAFLDTLGWVYYRLGEYDKAQPLLEKAVGGAESVSVLRYHLAMNYLAQGKRELARQHLTEALETSQSDFPGKDEAERTLEELSAGG